MFAVSEVTTRFRMLTQPHNRFATCLLSCRWYVVWS